MADIKHTTLSRGTKYYRVILNGIDPLKETPDTFALKLSMQTRAPITRINSIVRSLPATIKSGLDMSQARKFSSVVEELGGKTKIESYFVHPGESLHGRGGHRGSGPIRTAEGSNAADAPYDLQGGGSGNKVCISCGWENSEEASYCEFCHGKFRAEQPPDPVELKAQLPEENPLAEAEPRRQQLTLWDYIARHKIAFLVCLNVFLILVLIFRR